MIGLLFTWLRWFFCNFGVLVFRLVLVVECFVIRCFFAFFRFVVLVFLAV